MDGIESSPILQWNKAWQRIDTIEINKIENNYTATLRNEERWFWSCYRKAITRAEAARFSIALIPLMVASRILETLLFHRRSVSSTIRREA